MFVPGLFVPIAEPALRGPLLGSVGAARLLALEPVLELVAEAQQAGHLSERHAEIIGKTMRLLPPWVDGETRGQIESVLVDHALDLDPAALARVAARVLDRVDPDGREPAVDKARRTRDLRLYPRPDGSWRITGDLTPECGATWAPVLDCLSKPVPDVDGMRATSGRRGNAGTTDSWSRGNGC